MQCLASSELLTPHVYPPLRLWWGGRTHSLGGEGVGGNSLEDARHCSVLYTVYVSTLWLNASPHTNRLSEMSEKGSTLQSTIIFGMGRMSGMGWLGYRDYSGLGGMNVVGGIAGAGMYGMGWMCSVGWDG